MAKMFGRFDVWKRKNITREPMTDVLHVTSTWVLSWCLFHTLGRTALVRSTEVSLNCTAIIVLSTLNFDRVSILSHTSSDEKTTTWSTNGQKVDSHGGKKKDKIFNLCWLKRVLLKFLYVISVEKNMPAAPKLFMICRGAGRDFCDFKFLPNFP